jgi:hypothetical protein
MPAGIGLFKVHGSKVNGKSYVCSQPDNCCTCPSAATNKKPGSDFCKHLQHTHEHDCFTHTKRKVTSSVLYYVDII